MGEANKLNLKRVQRSLHAVYVINKQQENVWMEMFWIKSLETQEKSQIHVGVLSEKVPQDTLKVLDTSLPTK